MSSRARRSLRLEEEISIGERELRCGGSQRVQRARGRRRGRPVAPESTARIHDGRRRRWRQRRLHGVLRLAWLDEEVEGVAADLGSVSGRRGGGGGYGHGVRRRRQRFGRGERERCRGGRETRERGRDPGRCWALLARPGRRGGGTQAAAVARMRAVCGDHAPCPSSARRGPTGVGQSAGPSYWADRVSGPGKSLSPFLFSFLIF